MNQDVNVPTTPGPVLIKLQEMFAIQHGLNTKSYDSAWIEKGRSEEFDYGMAAGDEAHEFARSLPFQWWTKDMADRQNQVTELVDAWHFIMSQLIIDMNGNVGLSVQEALRHYEQAQIEARESTVQKQLKLFVAAMYTHNSRYKIACHYIKAFFLLCGKANVELDLLYARYVAKATLNKFRVENGYKQGTYSKIWTIGEEKGEDNFFLSRWVDNKLNMDNRVPTAEEVTAYLTTVYAMAQGKAEVVG